MHSEMEPMSSDEHAKQGEIRLLSMNKFGVWAMLDHLSSLDAAAFARRVETWGYGTLWIPESVGREICSSASWLLASTQQLNIASGIASIYARDPLAAACAQLTLNEQSNGRFLLGLGVSHIPIVEGLRRLEYRRPIEAIRQYMEGMTQVPYRAVKPKIAPKTVLAALGPKMLEVAAQMADGAHPYNVTPEHTFQARRLLGKQKLLCVEVAAILETDPSLARTTARQFLQFYLSLPNYVNNWKRLGFTDFDLAGGGSDRLIDAIFAWGDELSIRRRLDEHWQAGADHVCVQALGADGLPDTRLLELLAPTNS